MKNAHYSKISFQFGMYFWFSVVALFATPVFCQSLGERYTLFQNYNLGKVTLSNIEADLGNTALVKTSDAGESIVSICYRTPSGLLYFLSGELGGSEHQLLGFEFKKQSAVNVCSKWPRKRPVPKLVLNGLQLGMSKAKFSKIVNADLSWENDVATAIFESRREMTSSEIEKLKNHGNQIGSVNSEQPPLDVVVTIIGTFKSGKLVNLQVWKTETL